MFGSIIFCKRKREEGFKLIEIANWMRLDHTTVIYKLKQYHDLLQFNKPFRDALAEFDEKKFITEFNKFKKQKKKIK